MIRAKKQKRKICKCHNCGYDITISPDTVKEKTFEGMIPTIFEHGENQPIIATFIECPVCGERILKQLDTEETRAKAEKGVKLEMIQISGKKLSPKQKKRLQSIETMLYNRRKLLKELYWDETYQSLNQYEEEQTGMADLEPTQRGTGVLLRPITSGERMNEHETE